MNKLLSILVASTFALAGTAALAAEPPKDAAAAKKMEAAPKKPDNITDEAWAKMSDAEKAKAAEKAKMEAAPKKQKKGGC
jgi:Ni/Co efflux regulator RcnB